VKSNAQREQLLKLGSNIADLSEMCIQHGEWDRLLSSCAAVKNIWVLFCSFLALIDR